MLELISAYILSLYPEGFDPLDMLHSILYIVAVILITTMMVRLIHKKASQYNHALSSATALMFMYMLLFQIYRVFPDIVEPLLEKLPLIDLDADANKIHLYKFSLDQFSDCCREFLYLFILSFCLIGLDDIIPDAKNTPSWIVLQFIIACIALAIYYFILKCINHFAPDLLDSLAPMILVCILLFMVILGMMKVLLTLMLVAVNPRLVAVSAFFSSNKLGMALGKSIMCSLVMTSMVVFLGFKDLLTFRFDDLTLMVCYLPMALLAFLWVVIGHII